MTTPPDTESNAVRPLHVVMLGLTVMTVGGGMFLLSAAEPAGRVDGAIPWGEQSPLRAVVQLLCLNYQLPTLYPDAVKNLTLGLGAGLAILTLAVAVLAGSRPGIIHTDAAPQISDADTGGEETAPQRTRAHIAPLLAAQVLIGLYLLWSLASSRWSLAPDLSYRATALLAVHFFWAFALANGVSPIAARIATRWLIGITVATALLAVWYHFGRKPLLRADFPVGNPIFLAACLIPGILLTTGFLFETFSRFATLPRAMFSLRLLIGVVCLVPLLWAFYLTDARGPYIGLLFGALAIGFFTLRGRLRWIPLALACFIVAGGWWYMTAGDPRAGIDTPQDGSNAVYVASPGGRAETVRLRQYAWRYAWLMFTERPLTGHGQGAFTLRGDTYAVADVLTDPLVFESRISHAHNEWLEILADLGSIGLVLIAAALLLTLRAGQAALSELLLPAAERWALIALLASLIALAVQESFSVGLRIGGVPTMSYTLLGLSWAMSRHRARPLIDLWKGGRTRRIIGGALGGILGLATIGVAQHNFSAARQSYTARDALAEGDFDRAVRLSETGTSQLNVKRALVGYFSLAETHLQAARYFQERARDREFRARREEPLNARILALAEDDYARSDQHCERGSAWLKELVRRSPGYMNHGWLEYWVNRIRAGNLAARNDPRKQQALLQYAVIAIERELQRQPFNPALAADYVEPALGMRPFETVVEVFARPLRHHRIGITYADLLHRLAADPNAAEPMERIAVAVQHALVSSHEAGEPEALDNAWAPEQLRLVGAFHFFRGDYARAVMLLEQAASVYNRIAGAAPIGAASCFSELADARFYQSPIDARRSLAIAEKAIELAPESAPGRELKETIKARMVDYWIAAGDEDEALQLLTQQAPHGVSEEGVVRELGARYRRLCESLLGRREAAGKWRKPPAELSPHMQRWIARSLELNPSDPAAHFLSADLALYTGDDATAAEHLRKALALGLAVPQVDRFLQFALQQYPDSEPLRSLEMNLRQELGGQRTQASSEDEMDKRHQGDKSPWPIPDPE